MNSYKFKHFYFNKYILSRFIGKKYFMSYNYKFKTLWFRTYKVGSRTIDQHFRDNSKEVDNIYGSEMSYLPSTFDGYLKFAFVRNPYDKFLSVFKDKVLKQNYFKFSETDYKRYKNIDEFISWVEIQDIEKCNQHIRSQEALIDLNNLDFLGRFENFQDDFQELCRRIEMPVSHVYYKNKSSKKTLSLNDEQRRRIATVYEKDFQFFYPNK